MAFSTSRFIYSRAFGGTARLYRASGAASAQTAGAAPLPTGDLGLNWSAVSPSTPRRFHFTEEVGGARLLQRNNGVGVPVLVSVTSLRLPLPDNLIDGSVEDPLHGTLTYSNNLETVDALPLDAP
jgi:hypothetical protein